jgi:predicted small metal-binding protein
MAAKKVSCDCGKVIQQQSDDELVRVVQQHARDVHRMEMTREQVLAMAEPA